MSQEPDPESRDAPATALNWQDPPANRWAFWHVGDILPTYPVSRGDGPARPLPPSAAAAADLLAVPVTRNDQSAGTVGKVMADTYTDAYLVLQDGELVTEWYGPLGAPDRPHALMSVSKSVVGCVAAALIDRGQLDPDHEVTAYVPELAASGYAGALVRHVYDMRSGVRFLEEYANPDSDIRRLDEWVGREWAEQPGQGEPQGLYRFLVTLRAEAPHGQRFLYRSAESDVLGWVCERAAGRPMAALISELIWAPMGAGHDALMLHDGLGTAVHDGGLCATARDVARFGQMLLDGGLVPGGIGGVVSPQGGSGGMGPPGREQGGSGGSPGDPPRERTRGVRGDGSPRERRSQHRSGARPSPRQRRRYPPGGAAAVAPPGLGGGRRRQVRVRRVARRVGPSRRVVPAPVLVPPGRLRRRPAVPGHPRPDAARQPAHEHGVREVLHLARGAEPGLPGGHAARLRRGRRVPGRPRSAGAGRSPPGRGGLRPEPQRRHEPSEPAEPAEPRARRARRALP